MSEIPLFVFGLFLGVALSIPVTVGLIIALTREPRESENGAYVEPEIVVINPNVRGYLVEGQEGEHGRV